MKSNSITLDQLVPGRDGIGLTQPIDCVLHGGDLLAVQGANGTGKSTLLKTIAGLVQPVSGAVRFAGAAPAILYIGHRHGMLAGTSVGQNVSFWARTAGVPELAATAMHYFDLEPYADASIDSLSAGWQQRVSLARLITTPSPLWLLDEPSANLDAEGIGLLQSLFQTRIEQGGMILIASPHPLHGPAVRSLILAPAA